MAKPRDYVGEKFGRLTVISTIPKNERKDIRFKEVVCECECGNIIRCKVSNLVSGNTKSCGCYERELTSQRSRKPIVGKRFGRLVVLEEENCVGRTNNRKATCQCDCGNITKVLIGDLRSGMTKSCGCLKKEKARKLYVEDLTGQRFYELTAIHPIFDDNGGRVKWLWKCSCGKEYIALPINVKRGMTKSCGHVGKSKAEHDMFKFLTDNNIEFSYNCCPFEDLRNPETGCKLYIDFCFVKPNGEHIFVEHQGVQHYKENHWDGFGEQQRLFTDKIKKQYCQEKGIKLYETRYDEDYISHLSFILQENGLLKR